MLLDDEAPSQQTDHVAPHPRDYAAAQPAGEAPTGSLGCSPPPPEDSAMHGADGTSPRRGRSARDVPRRLPSTYLILAAILAVGLWLRVFGPTMHGFDWSDGQTVHVDEWHVRNIIDGLRYPTTVVDLFNPDSGWNPAIANGLGLSPVNGRPAHSPAGFDYGSLPLYLTKIFSSFLAWFSQVSVLDHSVPGFAMWRSPNTILAGRVLSGFFDTITLFLVFQLGRRLAGERTGLFAAALACFAVLSTQLAHFSTVDSFLGTFATGTILAGVTLYQEGRTRDYAIVGVWLAAALATKASAVPLLALVAVALLWRQIEVRRLLRWETFTRALLLGGVAFVMFFIFQPYTFVDWSTFKTGVQLQDDLATGVTTNPGMISWHGKAALLYPLMQLANCSLGLPLALLAYAGLVYQCIRVLAGKWATGSLGFLRPLTFMIVASIIVACIAAGIVYPDHLTQINVAIPAFAVPAALLLPNRRPAALVAFFVLVYFVCAGLLYVKYLRYMEPIVPALCVLAALLVPAVAGVPVRVLTRAGRGLGYAMGGASLVLTVIYGLAYQNIYSQPLTDLQASRWYYENIPPGAPIAETPYQGHIPLRIGSQSADRDRTAGELQMLAIYLPESLIKVYTLAGVLAHAHFYIEDTQFAVSLFAANGITYPYTQRFYRLLLGSGVGVEDPLGYTLIRRFIVHPQFGPWIDSEEGAEESFTEHDHPPVLIFKNTGNLSINTLVQILTDREVPAH